MGATLVSTTPAGIAENAAAGTTLAAALAMAAGEGLYVVARMLNDVGTSISFSDSVNGAYTLIGQRTDAAGIVTAHFRLASSSTGSATGTLTTDNNRTRGWVAYRVSGHNTAAPIAGSSLNDNAAAGANAIVSGTAVNSVTGLMLASSEETATDSSTPSAGTSPIAFVDDGTFWSSINVGARFEHKSIATTGSAVQATFTSNNGAVTHATTMVIWADAAATDQPPQDDFGLWVGDDAVFAADEGFVVEATMQSQSVNGAPNPISVIEWEEIDQQALYEEPPIETWEWSNPQNPNAPPNAIEHDQWQWFDEPDDAEVLAHAASDSGPVGASAASAQPPEDAWPHDDTAEDEVLAHIDDDDDPVGANGAPNPVEHEFWAWYEDGDDAELIITLDDDDDAVGPNAPASSQPGEDPLLDEDVDDDFWDDFGNEEGEPNLEDDPWDWFSDGADADEWPVTGDDDDDAVGPDAAQPSSIVDDAWDWFESADEVDASSFDDDDDAAGADAPASAQPPEDAFAHFDDGVDEDWQTGLDDDDDALSVDASPFPPDDPWEWSEDVHDPEPPAEYAFVDFVAPAASPPEDAWPHDDFGDDADLHALLDDDDDAVGPDAPADRIDDVWAPDDDFDDGAAFLESAPVADTDFAGQDDPWPWADETGDELALDDGAFADVISAPPVFEDTVALDEIEDDALFGTDAVGANFIVPASQFTADGWDWEIDLPVDDLVDEWLAWALVATYAPNPCFTVALPARLFDVALPRRLFTVALPVRTFTVRSARSFTVALPARSFTVRGPCHMTTLNRFDPKDPNEAQPLLFDFSADLAAGETLAGTVAVSVTVVKGIDPSPSAILAGGNSLDATSTKFFVPVIGGLDGVDYDVVVKYPTTNPKKTLVLGGILPVRAQ